MGLIQRLFQLFHRLGRGGGRRQGSGGGEWLPPRGRGRGRGHRVTWGDLGMVGGKAPVVFPLKDCFCFYLDVFTVRINWINSSSARHPRPLVIHGWLRIMFLSLLHLIWTLK